MTPRIKAMLAIIGTVVAALGAAVAIAESISASKEK